MGRIIDSMSSLQVGQVVTGKVTGITDFGVFVLLPDNSTGLVHISEVADSYVKDINDHLERNQEIQVKVISMAKGKIGLSIRKAQEKSRNNQKVFEDRLARFIKESDERLSDLKKNTEGKRGGRGGRRAGF